MLNFVGENFLVSPYFREEIYKALDGVAVGGEVMTKPYEVGDGDMFLNFSTSAIGGATVSVCDIDGKVIDGYESYIMFGDSTERPVEFKKPLSALKGQPVRLKFKLKDAHLYSFVFK